MKILMISDYDAPIGGIEQYIRDATQLLSTDDHVVTLVGLSLSSRLLHRIRPFLLPVTAFNIYFALKMAYKIITIKPELIRRHSVSRYVGWFPIWFIGLFRIHTWMMYHDLGYFHPYPRLLTDVKQISEDQTLQSWLQAGHEVGQTGMIKDILMSLKYQGTNAIRRSLIHSVSIHLVPSPYMIPVLESRGVPPTQIQVLGHFGRIE